MTGKRKSIPRTRYEGAKKKVQTSARSTPSKDAPQSEERDEPLPTRITNEKPLPTIKGDLALPDRSLKSICDSGVLAASLDRSRQRWLGEGLFEKYWTKPSKKKGYTEDPNNPARETMQKLGPCKVIVEPHVLDATLFAIREPQTAQPPSSSASAPVSMANPIMQYNPPTAESPAAYLPQNANVGSARQPQASLLHPNSPAPVPARSSPVPTTSMSVSRQDGPTVLKHSSPAIKSPQPPTAATPAAPVSAKHPSQDPVIQMLAHRASTNPELKVLMKIVASGTANGEQLKVFQGHIDDLTAILQRERESANQNPPPIGNGPPIGPAIRYDSTPMRSPALPAQQGKTPSTAFQPPTSFQPQPIKLATPTLPKADITGVAIEFTVPGSSGDRFLFPKNAILEFVPPLRQVIASFILVRKPETFSGGRYVATEKYHQPITIRISSDQPRVFDALSKAVAPAEEVRKHMDEIMSTTKRADGAQLALRLPIDGEGLEASEGGGSGTPTRVTGTKAFDKRLSISKSTQLAASPTSAVAQKIKERQFTWQDQHCQFCYTKVAVSSKLEERPVCQPCLALFRLDVFKNPLSYPQFYSSVRAVEPESSGPQYMAL